MIHQMHHICIKKKPQIKLLNPRSLSMKRKSLKSQITKQDIDLFFEYTNEKFVCQKKIIIKPPTIKTRKIKFSALFTDEKLRRKVRSYFRVRFRTYTMPRNPLKTVHYSLLSFCFGNHFGIN